MQGLCLYWSVVNLVAFLLYGLDKQKARMNRWRIPESVLIGSAVIGGAVGAYAGMKAFHHKTRKAKFYIGVPVILVIRAALALYIKLH